MIYSACIEWLFAAEGADFPSRIEMAKRAGLQAVEFWRWSDKDLDAVEAQLREHDMTLAAIVAEPMIALTDPANRSVFLEGLEKSIHVAQRLGAPVLIAQAGDVQQNLSRAVQKQSLIETLKAASDILSGTGVKLGLEPLNSRIDHVGYFLDDTVEAVEIVTEIDRPEIGLTYDIYHSAVMGEETEKVISSHIDRIFHVHVADHPGRNQPGSGSIDLANRLQWLLAQGYDGFVGLEFKPTKPTSEALSMCFDSLSGRV